MSNFTDPPSCPRNLRCVDVTSRSATIEWEVPEHNGGTEITGYIVEKRVATSKKWTKVVTLEAYNLQYTIENLKEKCEFIFRVYAENSIGLSEPAETENILLNPNASKCYICLVENSDFQITRYSEQTNLKVLFGLIHFFKFRVVRNSKFYPYILLQHLSAQVIIINSEILDFLSLEKNYDVLFVRPSV